MTNTSRWTLQFAFIASIALFGGPFLSTLPPAQAFPFTLFGLTGAQTIRLMIEETGLILLCLLSIRAFRQMPDNGKGFSFVRRVVLPMTALFIIIAMDNTLRVAGLSLIEYVGPRRYTVAHTAALLMAGVWISAAWLLNLDALYSFFSPSSPLITPKPMASPAEDSHDINETGKDDASATAMIPNGNGAPPATLGRYKVLKELGRGAMGVVYLGKDPTIQRFVAIKTMRLDEIDDADKVQAVKARFFREAESTGRLSHPNIITIYDAGEEHGLAYIAMEVLEGTTLKEWSRKPNLMPPENVLSILATVADALDYAHQQGVVHRDVKPANIMLTKEGVVKVMDFGIAKISSSSKTRSDMVLGTPIYMSPEQVAGKKVDGRSDIFSLGVVMFELLTGRPPFDADNVSALLFAIIHTPHPALTVLRPDLAPLVQEVLSGALHKDAVQRPRRANEFAQQLRVCLQGMAA